MNCGWTLVNFKHIHKKSFKIYMMTAKGTIELKVRIHLTSQDTD